MNDISCTIDHFRFTAPKDMLNPEAIAKTKPRGDLKSPRDLSHIIYKLLFHGNNTVQKRILIGLTG